MKIFFSHPIGNANVRAAATGLFKSDLLYKFETALACFPGNTLDRLGRLPLLSELRRRSFDPVLEPVTNMFPWYEVGRLLASKAGLSTLIEHESGLLSVDAVFKAFDDHVASKINRAPKGDISAVYSFEDASLSSFLTAKKLKIPCLYDLPIGYWRSAKRLLEVEREQRPEWISTLTGFRDSEKKLLRKDHELGLADRIFVASTFTAQTLKEFPGKLAPIEIIPYGFPPIGDRRIYPSVSGNKPLKLLFVGGLSQRKGISYLFQAVEKLKGHVELTIVGNKGSSECKALDTELVKHRWIKSLPHLEILKIMREHDVLIFPSLFEGFGLVITEAMSQGTPVITTERTAGPDVIKNNENGWIITAGSAQSLQAAIENLLMNRRLISEAGQAAIMTAQRRPWETYGLELSMAIMRHFQ